MNETIKGILIGITVTFLGGLALWGVQSSWRDQVSMSVEIVPAQQYFRDAQAISTIESSINRFLSQRYVSIDASKPDRLKEYLLDYARDRDSNFNFECAYEVTVSNSGTLPAEDAFIKLPQIIDYKILGSPERSDPIKVTRTDGGPIAVGEIRQGNSIQLVAFSNYSCAYNKDSMSAGHRDGAASLKYRTYPNNLPNVVLYHDFIFGFIFSLISMLGVLFLLVLTIYFVNRFFTKSEPTPIVAIEPVKSRSSKTKSKVGE